MRIVFLGSGAFGLPTLRSLAASHTLLAVVSQPDRPAGRGKALTPTPISEWALASLPGVPLFRPENINDSAVVAELRRLGGPGQADAWVIIAFGQKIGEPLIEGVRAMNLHGSLLPRWRGAAPINAAILAGDAETGNTVITIAQRMDAGLILGQSRRPIDPALTAGEIHDLLAEDGPALVQRILTEQAHGWPRGTPQDESLVTRARKLSKADGWLDFTRPAFESRRRVHGLTPWPGVTVQLEGKPLKLLRVRDEQPSMLAPASLAAGQLFDPQAGRVACADRTVLSLLEVQPAGGTPMPWSAFIRGRAIPVNSPIVSRAPEGPAC